MDLYTNKSYISAKEVYAVLMRYAPEKKTTTSGRLWWKKIKVEEIKKWEVEMDYLSNNGCRMTWISSGGDEKALEKTFEELMDQLRAQSTQWADRALENAIINGGTHDSDEKNP